MIRYPRLQKGQTFGVTAPSSGVQPEFHDLLRQSCKRMEERGFQVICGGTVWKQEKAKSAPALERANEFQQMMASDDIDHIFPPWGGQLLIEILEHRDFSKMQSKWVLGYSDTSVLLLALTLKTGIATAHGANLIDLRGKRTDETTAMWEKVLSSSTKEAIIQDASVRYQKEWHHDNPTEHVFHLTESTVWRTVSSGRIQIKGRLLGGCIDVIRHLAGTPFGDVKAFQRSAIHAEPILWYFENCYLNAVNMKRSLVQLKLAGWFDHCSGVMFGRSAANDSVEGYEMTDVYEELEKDLGVPIIYDIDCGHVPPQMTLVNGAYAEVEVEHGEGKITQSFLP
ncbi:S66 family peptidase [Bacillus sp. NPDC077027]|uniref:S66 family peptidase n=1 Tax=Bacillus sp. NPDC077027 TaxID=3390548 RepID=UPI003CFF12CA